MGVFWRILGRLQWSRLNAQSSEVGSGYKQRPITSDGCGTSRKVLRNLTIAACRSDGFAGVVGFNRPSRRVAVVCSDDSHRRVDLNVGLSFKETFSTVPIQDRRTKKFPPLTALG